MGLIANNMAELPTQPVVHALIVGVSDYQHLPGANDPPNAATYGLKKLSCGAASAYAFYQWLMERNRLGALPAPLGTCHLLLSPSPGEIADDLTALGVTPATFDNMKDDADVWRACAALNRDSTTIFFFAGHGLQRTAEDAFLLPQNFQNINDALELSNITNGMAPMPGFQTIARRQLYFIDACQNLPKALRTKDLRGRLIFDTELADLDDREAPILLASAPGGIAHGQVNGLTIFTEALLEALCIAAESKEGREWPVKVHELYTVLRQLVRTRANAQTLVQSVTLVGLAADVLVHRLPNAPEIDATLTVDPIAQEPNAVIELNAGDGSAPWTNAGAPRPPHPYRLRVKVGPHKISVSLPNGGPIERYHTFLARSPECDALVEI